MTRFLSQTIGIGSIGLLLAGAAPKETSWFDLRKDLLAEHGETTAASQLVSKTGPTLDETVAQVRRLGRALKGNPLVCVESTPKKPRALTLTVENAKGKDPEIVLHSNFGYGTPEVSELNVNGGLTSFLFGEEPSDIVVFNSDLGYEDEDRPAECQGFTHAAFLNTGDIAIGPNGITSSPATCCVLDGAPAPTHK